MADYSGFNITTPAENLAQFDTLDGLNIVATSDTVKFGILGSAIPGSPGLVQRTLYRGLVGINYIYSIDAPPPGATNIIVVGYTYV